MRRNEYKLLPHIKENVYGFNRSVGQVIGWELQKFDIPSQWSIADGKSVTVAVIDTGCDLTHEDIKDNIIDGANFIDRKKDPIDDNGHGTHVTGTIGAKNNGLGMVGIAPNCKIMPIKALNGDGSGNENSISKSIVWAADHNCDIITMSLGSPNNSLQIYNAIKYAINKGILIFCAAGNSGKNVDIMYPARYDETIAIGSIDRNLKRSNFTCSGDSLEFLAPGQDIFSCAPNNNYTIMSGTSMANPFAVGYASLIMSYARHNRYNIKFDKAMMINILKINCLNLSDSQYQYKKYQGYGIINPDLKKLNLTNP